MNYYQDITLIPDEEANLGFLWQKLYQQIHIAFAENKDQDGTSTVALSIPDYGAKGFPLGAKIRLFANTQQALAELNIEKWLARYSDYAHIKTIKATPDNVSEYACFTRKHANGENRVTQKIISKAKHISEKFNIDYEQALVSAKEAAPKPTSSLPFIWLNSLSTKTESKKRFPLFIAMEKVQQPQQGAINCYGLSLAKENNKTTVPWF